MALHASGAAVVDRSGAILVADGQFLFLLGLPAGDPSALRSLARTEPALGRLLSAEGPAAVALPLRGRAPLEIERVAGETASLLLVREPAHVEEEHAMRSRALGALASGVAHDIRNPLNAISLQVALLSEKIAGLPAEVEAARHLGTVREQLLRVDEVVRRLVDVVDPPTPRADLGALVADVAALLGHEARRRRIAVAVEVPRRKAEAAAEPARVARLVVGIVAGALAETPDGGRLSARVVGGGGNVTLTLEHTGAAEGGSGEEGETVPAMVGALGGTFALRREGDDVRRVLVLPGSAGP